MRLIDADALKAKWYKINDIDENDRGTRFVGYTEIARLIDQAPTVSADAVQGVWEHIESKWEDNIFKCSKCGNPLQIPTVDGEPIYNYCVHCGAKMGNAWGERND